MCVQSLYYSDDILLFSLFFLLKWFAFFLYKFWF